MLLFTDKRTQTELKSAFANADLRVKPMAHDVYGRGYYWIESLQPLLGCRIYRTLGTEDMETQRRRNFKVTVPEGKAYDLHECWEVVVNGEKVRRREGGGGGEKERGKGKREEGGEEGRRGEEGEEEGEEEQSLAGL